MSIGMRRRLARVADWLREPGRDRGADGRTFDIDLDDGRHVTATGFAIDVRPPGLDTGDVLERSRSDAVSVVLLGGVTMDLPLARIARVRSGRAAPAYLREHMGLREEDRVDLADPASLGRFLSVPQRPHREFAGLLVDAARVTVRGDGAGPAIVLAADLEFHSRREDGPPMVERLAAAAGRMADGVADPATWGRGIHATLGGPLGRDLRDLDDAGGVSASLAIAVRCSDVVLAAAGRPRAARPA